MPFHPRHLTWGSLSSSPTRPCSSWGHAMRAMRLLRQHLRRLRRGGNLCSPVRTPTRGAVPPGGRSLPHRLHGAHSRATALPRHGQAGHRRRRRRQIRLLTKQHSEPGHQIRRSPRSPRRHGHSPSAIRPVWRDQPRRGRFKPGRRCSVPITFPTRHSNATLVLRAPCQGTVMGSPLGAARGLVPPVRHVHLLVAGFWMLEVLGVAASSAGSSDPSAGHDAASDLGRACDVTSV